MWVTTQKVQVCLQIDCLSIHVFVVDLTCQTCRWIINIAWRNDGQSYEYTVRPVLQKKGFTRNGSAFPLPSGEGQWQA